MNKIITILFLSLFISNIYSQDNTSDNSQSSSTSSASSSTSSVITNNKPADKNGWDYYLEGRYIDSINALKKEKINYPARINIYVILGWDYKILKNYSEMENISLEGLNISADDTRVILNLIEAYYYQNKYQKAVTEIEKYISYTYKQNDQNTEKMYYYMGVCYYNLNQYRKADISFTTAKYYLPNDYNLLLNLAMVKEKLNEKQKAKDYYNKALSIKPNDQDALDGLKRLGVQ